MDSNNNDFYSKMFPNKTASELKQQHQSIPVIQNSKVIDHRFDYVPFVQRLSEVQPENQQWLWEGFIPYHTCTLIAGMPGIGKSQFLMWLAAQVSNGQPFTLNSLEQRIDQGSVLIVACEDDPNTALAPRLLAKNANPEKIHLFSTMQFRDEPEKKRLLALDEDIIAFEKIINDISDVKLIIIDPISGFLGRVRDHIDSEVRNFLMRLNLIAKRYNLAIVINKHLRKQKESNDSTSAISQVAGSGAWIAAMRQSFLIAPWHEDEEKILFVNLKVNLNKKQTEALGYQIESYDHKCTNGEVIKTSCIQWLNEKITITADEAVIKPQANSGNRVQIVDMLFNLLTSDFQKQIELKTMLFEQNPELSISQRTFERACKELRKNPLVLSQMRFDRKWEHCLVKK